MDKSKVDYIMNVLRLGTLTWQGRNEVFKLARKQVLEGHTKSGKPVYKYYWKCAVCHEWSRDIKNFEADHIIEIGGFKGSWDDIINRMYADPSTGWQCLCLKCHAKKTAAYNAAALFERKRK